MDYEEKYEMALETVQEILNSGSDSIKMSRLRLILQSVFHELKESEDERIRKAIIEFFKLQEDNTTYSFVPKKDILAWLEKQGGQKSLYIRFGDVPNNEKSKIYHGEIEIGEENGVSAYHAFEVNGNIVLGLTLPITKTTLYTQQHLLEYDNRPCYLVKGNYVGKDTDGQPLIDNVSIIRKIDSYRVKEEKVDNKNYVKSAEKQGEQKPSDKVESKFKVGDWISGYYTSYKVLSVNNEGYVVRSVDGNIINILFENERFHHLWTIKDAKDGDVLVVLPPKGSEHLFIFKEIKNSGYIKNALDYYCELFKNDFRIKSEFGYIGETNDNFVPATKEQRDLLFAKMKEVGYEWDAEKKELRRIEQECIRIEELAQHIKAEFELFRNLLKKKGIDYNPDDVYWTDFARLFVSSAKKLQKSAEWSEEDEKMLARIIERGQSQIQMFETGLLPEQVSWLKSLRPQTKQE